MNGVKRDIVCWSNLSLWFFFGGFRCIKQRSDMECTPGLHHARRRLAWSSPGIINLMPGAHSMSECCFKGNKFVIHECWYIELMITYLISKTYWVYLLFLNSICIQWTFTIEIMCIYVCMYDHDGNEFWINTMNTTIFVVPWFIEIICSVFFHTNFRHWNRFATY